MAAVAACVILAPQPGRAQEKAADASHSRVGVRIGGLATFDGFNDKYGDGWQMSLFFTERMISWLDLEIRIGALYMGDLQDAELDDEQTGRFGIGSAMRILYFSAGPMVDTRLGSNTTGYLSAGVGVYSVSIEFDSGVTSFDFSDQDVGFNGGAGLSRRLSTNWSVEANTTLHYVIVSDIPQDIYYSFTEGADAPFILDISLGVTLGLR